MSKKSDLEFNKLAAAILVAGLIAMTAGKLADVFYHGEEMPEKRGYEVEVVEGGAGISDANAAEEEAPLDIAALMAAASVENGEKLAKKCQACHNFEKGEPNKSGPNLWGALGAEKAHLKAGFAYSDAMLAKGGKWDYADMFAFLHKPKAFIKGTQMGFAGFKKPEEIADMVAYLRTKSDTPPALPQ